MGRGRPRNYAQKKTPPEAGPLLSTITTSTFTTTSITPHQHFPPPKDHIAISSPTKWPPFHLSKNSSLKKHHRPYKNPSPQISICRKGTTLGPSPKLHPFPHSALLTFSSQELFPAMNLPKEKNNPEQRRMILQLGQNAAGRRLCALRRLEAVRDFSSGRH